MNREMRSPSTRGPPTATGGHIRKAGPRSDATAHEYHPSVGRCAGMFGGEDEESAQVRLLKPYLPVGSWSIW